MCKPLLLFMVLVCLMPAVVPAQQYLIGDHNLLLMPTAYSIPAKSSYFTDYELIFLNYTIALGSRTHIGVYTLFPITSSFLESITLEVKQNYLRSSSFQGALIGSYTPKANLISIGNVFSIGKRKTNFHIGASAWGNLSESDWEVVLMAGLQTRIKKSASLLIEYTNFSSLLDDFNGLISLGVRLRSDKIAWEIGGIRPLEYAGDLFLWPFLKATAFFN